MVVEVKRLARQKVKAPEGPNGQKVLKVKRSMVKGHKGQKYKRSQSSKGQGVKKVSQKVKKF